MKAFFLFIILIGISILILFSALIFAMLVGWADFSWLLWISNWGIVLIICLAIRDMFNDFELTI